MATPTDVADVRPISQFHAGSAYLLATAAALDAASVPVTEHLLKRLIAARNVPWQQDTFDGLIERGLLAPFEGADHHGQTGYGITYDGLSNLRDLTHGPGAEAVALALVDVARHALLGQSTHMPSVRKEKRHASA